MERSCQMIETNGKKLFRGEAALALAVLINSFGVVLMLYSGALILSLMIMRKKFVTSYLFSFAVGFVFSELADITKIAYPKIKIGFDVTCLYHWQGHWHSRGYYRQAVLFQKLYVKKAASLTAAVMNARDVSSHICKNQPSRSPVMPPKRLYEKLR